MLSVYRGDGMPRISRIVGVGLPHHVTQRGNYGAQVFETDADRGYYLNLVSRSASLNGLSILSYCLMPNHVHFVVVPGREDSMALAFRTAHMRYAQYVNWKRNLRGHLWQGRFYSCLMDPRHLLAAARYVELNPVRAGISKTAGGWEWSSAPNHMGIKPDNFGFDLDGLWAMIPDLKTEWREYLAGCEDASVIGAIRTNTATGRPIGAEAFIKMMEKRLGRRLFPLKVGRPGLLELSRIN